MSNIIWTLKKKRKKKDIYETPFGPASHTTKILHCPKITLKIHLADDFAFISMGISSQKLRSIIIFDECCKDEFEYISYTWWRIPISVSSENESITSSKFTYEELFSLSNSSLLIPFWHSLPFLSWPFSSDWLQFAVTFLSMDNFLWPCLI